MSGNEPEKKKSPFFWRNISILLAGIATAILFAGIILVCYALLNVNNHFAMTLEQLTNRLNQSQTLITEANNKTSDALKAQSQIIADIQKEQHTNKNDFIIAETFYLVKLANDSLLYESNIPVAIKLIQSADQALAKLSDPKSYPVREALAADLVTLQSASPVDVAGTYARLSALSEQVNKLPLITQLLNRTPTVTTINNETLPWWRRGLNSMHEALSRIVIVRQNLPNQPPFIAPDQQLFLIQNLQAELENAQWSLLHHEPAIYRQSLLQATNWIKQYTAQDSPITKQLLQSLAQLQEVNIRPSVPNLTASMHAIENYMNTASP